MTWNTFLIHCDIFCATLPTCSTHDVVTSSSSPLNDVLAMLQHLRQVACNTFLIRCNIFLLVSKLHDLPDTCVTSSYSNLPDGTDTLKQLLQVSSNMFLIHCDIFLIRWNIFWKVTCNSYDRIKMSCSSSLSHLLQSYSKTSMSLSIGAAIIFHKRRRKRVKT